MTRSIPALALALLLGCGAETQDEPVDLAPRPFEDEECGACGMIVRDQPSPRAQLVHRDGTRVYFCAIADLVTYGLAPSPHGRPLAIHAEVMPADADPADLSTEPRPFRPVEDIGFVVGGFERPVMGEPVLTFESMAAAREAAARLGGRAMGWDALQQTLGEGGRAHEHH